ncbi:medium-chain acyl-CoA ligase ACSF2, mitochondrial-like [Amphiura filiformis]|uniref:medium-chain acyl-CoA ligase ACSF2, mitochondrial-like n=1 Tax=Amphiura filiformis TaxID=82378 RepID=UPI003B227F96
MSPKLTKSYIHVPEKTSFSGKSVWQRFNEMANQNPDKEMYIFFADNERKTFRQMQEESQQFAGGLLKFGLKKGDTLGIWGGNHYEWLLAYLASLQIGVITLGIKVVVLMRSPSDMCDRASQIIPELLTNPADNLNCQIGMISLTDFMEMGKGFDRSTVTNAIDRVDFDDPISVTFTSGSTGFPKGVTHTHRSVLLFPEAFARVEEDTDGNPVQFPTYHYTQSYRYALIMSFGGLGAQVGALMPMIKGSTTIIVGPTYDTQLLVNAIQSERGVNSAVKWLSTDLLLGTEQLTAGLYLSEIRVAGGSIIPHSLRQRATKFTKHLLLAYGGSEGFVFPQLLKDPIEILHSPAYAPLDGSEVKIIGHDGQILPINEIGEICVRNRSLFLYYWGEEEKTKAAKKPNGWCHTGDLGTLDENGYLRVVGRKAERIIKKGTNIAPGHLEKVLDEHPAVSNVMASNFLVPKYILFVEDAFPTTETGKVSKILYTQRML